MSACTDFNDLTQLSRVSLTSVEKFIIIIVTGCSDDRIWLIDFKYYSWISVTCETVGFNLAPPEFEHSVRYADFSVYLKYLRVLYSFIRTVLHEQQIHFSILKG